LSIFIKIAWYSAKTTIFEIGYTQYILKESILGLYMGKKQADMCHFSWSELNCR